MAKNDPKQHVKITRWKSMMESRINLSDVMVNPNFEQEYINTGSTVLNLLIGGSRLPNGKFVCPGYPKGTIIEIFGRESSGKSTFALTAMGQALSQANNTGCGLYVDLEHAVKDNYAARLGCDFRSVEMGGSGNAIRVAPRTFEETEALVDAACLQGIDLVVVDSVAGLVSGREYKRDIINSKEKQGVAEVPRLMSNWMPKLQGIIAKTRTTVIFLNQTRDKIGAMGYTEEALKSTTGGNALKFWASLRWLLAPKQQAKAKRWNPIIKEHEEVPIATDVLVKNIKNKIDARTGHSGMVTVRYGVGIDELRTMLNVADAYKVIDVSKNKMKQDVYKYKDIEEVGVEKFRVALKANPDILAEMLNTAQERMIVGLKAIEDEELAQLAEGARITKIEDPSENDYEDDGGPPEVTEAPFIKDYEEIVGDGPSLEEVS